MNKTIRLLLVSSFCFLILTCSGLLGRICYGRWSVDYDYFCEKLREGLKGKTKDQIIQLFGDPHHVSIDSSNRTYLSYFTDSTSIGLNAFTISLNKQNIVIHAQEDD